MAVEGHWGTAVTVTGTCREAILPHLLHRTLKPGGGGVNSKFTGMVLGGPQNLDVFEFKLLVPMVLCLPKL